MDRPSTFWPFDISSKMTITEDSFGPIPARGPNGGCYGGAANLPPPARAQYSPYSPLLPPIGFFKRRS